MKIVKSIEIKKNPQEVFDYLKITKNQDNFSVWNMADPDMTKNYQGTDGRVGFIYRWDSKIKNVGAGEIEISNIKDGKEIDYTLRFHRPMENTGQTEFLVDPLKDNNTLVTWKFEAPSKFPYSLISPIFKRMMGKDLSKGLSNLKGILEKPM
jgi:hypothetical protein